MTRLGHCKQLLRSLGLLVVVVATLAACASTPSPSASPGASSPPTPTASPAIGSPSAVASASPVASAPVPPVGSPAACTVETQTGLLPSDRLVDLAITSTATHDVVTFVFEPSLPGPAGAARGTLEAAQPPFSFAGSGQSIELRGQHAVQLRFSGMTIANESGEATYHGPTEAKPALTTLREAIQYDASEGIIGWYLGYDGPGCVTLVREGAEVSVMIAHPEAPAG
jgi:hypothetical protein